MAALAQLICLKIVREKNLFQMKKGGEVGMSERNRLCIKREFCNDDCMTCTKAVKVELMSEIVNGKVITRPNGIHKDKGRKVKRK